MLGKVKEKLEERDPTNLPVDVTDRITRGRARMKQGAAMRDLCLRFYRDDLYAHVDAKGILQTQATTTTVTGGGKPLHRVRTKRNLVTPLIDAKVSSATQRVPSYEVNPSSFDPQRVSAASLAEKVAVYGYDKWRVRRATKKLVTLALVADEGFALPIWDASVGPFVPDDEKGSYVGLGEVRVLIFSRNQVGWEPGVEFDDSPFYFVDRALPLDEAYALDGYMGGKLTPDASTSSDTPQSQQKNQGEKLVLVTEYFERPCPKYPMGRWMTTANGRVIAGIAEGEKKDQKVVRPYPLTDGKGRPMDEPVLHRLSYRVDPDSDEDLGMMRYLIDGQRSYQDIWNKALEWKNRCLNPQMNAPVGSMKKRKDDTPGAINYYVPVGGMKPEWETVPPIPESLFRLLDETRQDLQTMAAAQEIPNQVEAGKAISAFIEQQQAQWQSFIADLAEVHSRLMRHCLYLVQRHYTEDRAITIRGRWGWESIDDFKGADLLGEADVRVFPGSIASMTRQQIQDWLNFLIQAFPGQITLEQAMAALEQGTAEDLIKSYQLDVARANRIVQKIIAGPEVLFGTPDRVETDPITGGVREVPGWMPRRSDNIVVQKHVFEDFFKTDAYDRLEPGIQTAANEYYNALLKLEQMRAFEEAQQQTQMAEGMGMANAAKPQGPTPMPSLPGPNPTA